MALKPDLLKCIASEVSMEVLDQYEQDLLNEMHKLDKWMKRLQKRKFFLNETAKRTGINLKKSARQKIEQLDLFAS